MLNVCLSAICYSSASKPTVTFGVRSGVAQSLDILLHEVTAEDFKRASTRFKLVAKAKEWEQAKQLSVLPIPYCEESCSISMLNLMMKRRATLRVLRQHWRKQGDGRKIPWLLRELRGP